jgi:hypothetical protein
MAVMQSRDNRTLVAGADLSAKQFHFVKTDAAMKAVVAGAGEEAFGVLIVQGTAGKAVTVTVMGKTMVECGATVAIGAAVSANAAGEAITSTVGDRIMGHAYEAGVDGQIIAIELIQAGPLKL